MITQSFDLNMIPDSEPVVVHVNQYDTGTGRLIAHLYNGDVAYTPTGTAAIQGTKPDGRGFMYSATLSGSTVTADLKDQMSVVAGRVRCQIVVTETTGITGTFCFDLYVQASALPDDAEVSESDYPIIEELIHEAQTAAATAVAAEVNAEDSAEDSEAWAVGTRGGVPVTPDDPTYHNSSRWWAEHGGGGGGSAHTIVNAKGQDMTARTALKFANMKVTDDATHNQTVVESGSVIKITTTEVSLRGENVTLSDGTTTLTETFDSSGDAVFYGVPMTGNLTITSTDGTDTAKAIIPVEYFGNYEKNITFFTAPITITTDSPLFFGKTVTVKDSHNTTVGSAQFSSPSSGDATATVDVQDIGVYTASCTADDGGTDSNIVSVTSTAGASVSLHLWNNALVISTGSSELASAQISITKEVSGQQVPVGVVSFPASGTLTTTFNVHETGTYTTSVSYSGDIYYDTHTVSAEGTTPYTIVTIPDGSTVTPTDDIQTWLECAGIRDKTSYTTLSDVLADHDTLYRLMASDNAANYLVRSTAWVSGITADEYAMKYIGKWNYASDTLLDNSTWRTAICNSTYFESVLNAKVPTMTSNTTPSGTASAKDTYTSEYQPWKAFDGTNIGGTDAWISASGTSYTPSWIQYEFVNPAAICKVRYVTRNASAATAVNSPKEVVLKAYDSVNDTWDTLASNTSTVATVNTAVSFSFSNNKAYTRYRLDINTINKTTTGADQYFVAIGQLQFYGRTDVTENLIDIYSAASDPISITDNDISLVVETDTTGHGTIAKSSLPNGTYTFTSTVAKDPSNLSNAYSKSITVTDGTSEIHLMPDVTAYWYGWAKGAITANPYKPDGFTNTTFTPTITQNRNNLVITTTGTTTTSSSDVGLVSINGHLDATGREKIKMLYKPENDAGYAGSATLINAIQNNFTRLDGTTNPTVTLGSFGIYYRELNSGTTSGYASIIPTRTSTRQPKWTINAIWLE